MDDLSSKLPEQLSPSRLKDFDQCPRLFYYKTIERLPSPATTATTKGTLAHYALEKIFDHPREERIPANATPYVRVKWAELAKKPDYAGIVESDPKEIESMLLAAEDLVVKWFNVERPDRFDPVGREMWVYGEIGGCKIRGIIDRLDEVPVGEESIVYVGDYKSGRVPSAAYVNDAFFAMDIYAELVEQQTHKTPRFLRLIYIKNGRRDDVIRREVTTKTRVAIRTKVEGLWNDIQKAAKSGEFVPKTSRLCDWCSFRDICPAWNQERPF